MIIFYTECHLQDVFIFNSDLVEDTSQIGYLSSIVVSLNFM